MLAPESEVRFENFSGSGPGGQHRNRHANCVRATHVPTGVVASATSERSQRQNRAAALAALRGKLARMVEEAAAARRKGRRDAKPAAGFGVVAIRTYRLGGPDAGVVDHRTGLRAGLDALRRGRIEPLLAAGRAAGKGGVA